MVNGRGSKLNSAGERGLPAMDRTSEDTAGTTVVHRFLRRVLLFYASQQPKEVDSVIIIPTSQKRKVRLMNLPRPHQALISSWPFLGQSED